MKILLVTDFFPVGKDLRFSGGVEARSFYVAKNLSRKHRISVITSRLPGTKVKEKTNGFTVYRPGPVIKYNSGSSNVLDVHKKVKFILAAIALGKKLEIDICDGGNFVDHFIAKRIANYHKKPVIFWYPDVFIGQWIRTSGIFSGTVGYILERFNISASANYFIAISEQTKIKLLNQGVSSKNITVIPCGIDEKEYSNKKLDKRKKTIITINRLVSYKNIKDLVFAFALLVKKGHKVNLKIIGSGPQKKLLKDLVRELKIQNKVKFAQNLPRKELIKELSFSYIFCSPSSVEGFGISVIEAAAAGIPYVISDIDVFKEVTKNGLGGLFFKLGNINSLSNTLEKYLKDDKLYLKKEKEGEKLAKNYSWKKISNQTESLYRKFILKWR